MYPIPHTKMKKSIAWYTANPQTRKPICIFVKTGGKGEELQ